MYDPYSFIPHQSPEEVPQEPPHHSHAYPAFGPAPAMYDEAGHVPTVTVPSTTEHPVAAGAHTPAPEPPGLEASLAHYLDTPEPSAANEAHVPLVTPARHRKRRLWPPQHDDERLTWRRTLSVVSVSLTALMVVLVTVLGAMASYQPLHQLAHGVTPPAIAQMWPLMIYGPWLVGTLSILRARAYKRRTPHSWLVVTVFAALAAALCVINAPHSPSGMAVAGLPPVTVLLCFHQLVRQLDLACAPPPGARHAHTDRGTHRNRPL